MTFEKVMALSTKELLAEAIKLMDRPQFVAECWDPTHDIAAAWELWEKGEAIGEQFWMALLEVCDNGDQTTIYQRVLREINPRNITRAYVLAETQREET